MHHSRGKSRLDSTPRAGFPATTEQVRPMRGFPSRGGHMLRTFRALTPIGLVVLALAVLANAVGIADGKGKPKAATLTLTVTPHQVKTGTKYTVGLTGYSGRFTKLAVSGHKS